MDEKQWIEATKRTGMNKAQINKYLWDLKNRNYRNEQIAKRQCGIIFEIYNTKTKKTVTSSYVKKYEGSKIKAAKSLFSVSC